MNYLSSTIEHCTRKHPKLLMKAVLMSREMKLCDQDENSCSLGCTCSRNAIVLLGKHERVMCLHGLSGRERVAEHGSPRKYPSKLVLQSR